MRAGFEPLCWHMDAQMGGRVDTRKVDEGMEGKRLDEGVGKCVD